MTIKKLAAEDISFPSFDIGDSADGDVFSFSSHQRARDALELGLGIDGPHFNIFVLGDPRSGRLSSTVEFIKTSAKTMKPPADWVYLNNFQKESEPHPYTLPAGIGYEFSKALAATIEQLTVAMRDAFGGDDMKQQLQEAAAGRTSDIQGEVDALRETARSRGFDIIQTDNGTSIAAIDDDGNPVPPAEMSAEQQQAAQQYGPDLAQALTGIMAKAAENQAALQQALDVMARDMLDQVCAPILDAMAEQYGSYPGLAGWFVEFRADIVENYKVFLAETPADLPADMQPGTRYAVNLLSDNRATTGAPVIVEPNPTYQNLFGQLQYRQSEQGYATDFTLIQSGALHRANGGVLVLRADMVAEAPAVWGYLKAALRDGEIRIEEPHRANSLPVAGAVRPAPVPLSLKVVMVAAPRWYYSFFASDPEFQTYFKIKADIDADMESSAANVDAYSALIRDFAVADGAKGIEGDAIALLLGLASRWAANRGRLSSQFERINDVIVEAHQASGRKNANITRADILQALANHHSRVSRIPSRMLDSIAEETVLIETTGSAVGQVNALTVRYMGDTSFGMPSRVTARASVGRHGVVNIERDVALGGPIQQKGVMVLQGFLAGIFARRFPLSFNCSVTFEQSYGGVEGDSASLAELMAILSDLSSVPLRQDLAITGSVNQRGDAQAIGGANQKIAGFFRTCLSQGPLTGSQGVIIPVANERNVILLPEISDAVAAEKFHIHSVTSVDDAIELFTGQSAEKIYALVTTQLEAFDQALTKRAGGND
jgi:predicted ATP-dependent protease